MDLETLVRDTFREHAAEAPAPDRLLSAVTGRRPARTRWIVGGLSAAAAVALAVSLAAVRGSAPAPKSATPPGSSSDAPTLTTPSGYTRIAYHDVTVAVPDGLPVITTPCLAPARYVWAEDPGVSYSCAAQSVEPAQQTLTVRLTSARSASDRIATEPTEIGGMPARIGYGSLDGFPGAAGEAVFAAEDLAVVVTAPQRSTVEQILTSVRREADPNGCPADFPVPADPSADALVPGAPVSAVRCVYAITRTGYVLQASLPVHPAALDPLVQAINALPPDTPVSPQRPFENDLLRLTYADGGVRTVRIDLSDPTTYSDGIRKGYDHGNAVTDQLRSATS